MKWLEQHALAAAILFLSLMSAGCVTSSTRAAPPQNQSQSVETSNVVLAVRTPRHLNVAMLTARQMLDGEGSFTAARVDVVACGDAVVSLTQDSEGAVAVRDTLDRGVRIVACGITIEQKGIDPSTLLPRVEVVPNGLTEIVRLQSIGFYSVEL